MEIRIARVQTGTNEDGIPIMGPDAQTPERFVSLEITETEYVYQVAGDELPEG